MGSGLGPGMCSFRTAGKTRVCPLPRWPEDPGNSRDSRSGEQAVLPTGNDKCFSLRFLYTVCSLGDWDEMQKGLGAIALKFVLFFLGKRDYFIKKKKS